MEELITKRNKDVVTFFESLEELIACLEDAFEETRPLLNAERYLTDKEVAEILKVSRRTLQDYRNQGVLSYILLGGKVLYKESDLEKTLNSNYIKAFQN